MEKLSEKINAMAICKTTKDGLIRIAEQEQIQIQQVCRRLLKAAVEAYDRKRSSRNKI